MPVARRGAAPSRWRCGAAADGGGDDDDGGSAERQHDVSGTISIVGVWTGDEQKKFQAVLDGFKEQYPNVNVKYTSGGDKLPTVLSTAVEGGNPPDLAASRSPG